MSSLALNGVFRFFFSIINTFSLFLFLFFPDKGICTHMAEVNLERGGNKHDRRSKPCGNEPTHLWFKVLHFSMLFFELLFISQCHLVTKTLGN